MPSDGKPMFGCRVPPEWKERFEKLAVASGRKPADLAREAFADYLGIETDSTAIGDVKQLAERVAAIEKKLKWLAHPTS